MRALAVGRGVWTKLFRGGRICTALFCKELRLSHSRGRWRLAVLAAKTYRSTGNSSSRRISYSAIWSRMRQSIWTFQTIPRSFGLLSKVFVLIQSEQSNGLAQMGQNWFLSLTELSKVQL